MSNAPAENIICVHSPAETARAAADYAKTLAAGDVICLHGGLGVGKTVFTGGLLAALGVTEPVTSPTFTLVNEYETDSFRVCHFDLYRIEDEDELYQIGFDDFLNSGAVCVIEWPQNAGSMLPPIHTDVIIARTGLSENDRIITIKKES